MRVGRIYDHAAFYGDSFSGELLGKYLVILALPKAGDVVFRVLTSRHAPLRPSGCHHGTPYPGFSLGVPGGVLTRPTWVDLREQDDYDSNVFQGRIDNGLIRPQQQLHSQQLGNCSTVRRTPTTRLRGSRGTCAMPSRHWPDEAGCVTQKTKAGACHREPVAHRVRLRCFVGGSTFSPCRNMRHRAFPQSLMDRQLTQARNP